MRSYHAPTPTFLSHLQKDIDIKEIMDYDKKRNLATMCGTKVILHFDDCLEERKLPSGLEFRVDGSYQF